VGKKGNELTLCKKVAERDKGFIDRNWGGAAAAGFSGFGLGA
jgi:hypothetical protein